jgi:hypothetical protein
VKLPHRAKVDTDAALEGLDPALFAAAVNRITPRLVAAAVNRIIPRPVEKLAEFIPRFSAERFLSDYLEDAKLWFRLNQVMRRVKLPELPRDFLGLLPEARSLVRKRRVELLTP